MEAHIRCEKLQRLLCKYRSADIMTRRHVVEWSASVHLYNDSFRATRVMVCEVESGLPKYEFGGLDALEINKNSQRWDFKI